MIVRVKTFIHPLLCDLRITYWYEITAILEGMAIDICIRFGRRLQHLRKRKGFKQIDLAVCTGFSREHISRLENGRKDPSLRTLEALATALDIHPSDLIKGV